MTIWGKIIGGAAGFAIGGPIGALLGAIAGHAVDTYTQEFKEKPSPNEVAFTIALIALSAKMAKADGRVSHDEIAAFRQKVDIMPNDLHNVGKLWDLARQTPDGFDGYARQVAKMFTPASPILEQMMELLFFIARADGNISPNEEEYLFHVARILGYSSQEFNRLKLIYSNENANPYYILNVDPNDDIKTIRKAWIKLAQDNHPDKLQAQGLPDEFIRAANERLATINTAYNQISKVNEANQNA